MNMTTTTDTAIKPANALDALKALKPSGASKKDDSPYYPADEIDMLSIDQCIEGRIMKENITGALDIAEGEIKSLVAKYLWDTFSGRDELPSTIKAKGTKGTIGITFANQYSKVDSESETMAHLRRLMGFKFDELMRQECGIEIKTSAIPANRLGDFLTALVGLAQEHGATEAINYKTFYVPTSSFHNERLRLFGPEGNSELHRHLPCRVSVKTKGVK